MTNRTFPKNPNEVPKGEHWVILTGSSIHVPGEGEWAPGHGYPAHNENYLSYECYTDVEAFKAEVRQLAKDGRKNFRALHVLPVTVEVNVDVKA